MLESIPEPKTVVTAGEAVRELAPLLKKLRRKGHSTAKISETFVKYGIAIGSSTLNSYLRRSPVARAKDSHESGEPPLGTSAEHDGKGGAVASGGAPNKVASEKPDKTNETTQSREAKAITAGAPAAPQKANV